MTKANKQYVLNKIEEMDKSNYSLCDAQVWVLDSLLKVVPKEIREAHDKMISNKIPF